MRPRPQEILRRADITAMLISNLTNIRYLTGMQLSAGLLLVRNNRYVLFVDDRYREAASKDVHRGVQVMPLEAVAEVLRKIRKCGFESADVTISRLSVWKKKFKSTKFVQKEGIVEWFRRSKDAQERRLMKKADAITVSILGRIERHLKPGISEADLAWKIETWARELGAESMSFEPIVAFGANSSRPHHHPTHKTLRSKDIVQIDIGVRYKGYCSDRSRVFFPGRCTQKQADALAAVLEAKERCKKAAVRGASVRSLDRMAREILKEHGMEEAFTHSLGHGVGLEIHEGVTLSQRGPDDEIQPGEVVTIEPGVYFPGKFGIRLEDMVFVR